MSNSAGMSNETQDPGVHNGPNIVGTDLEQLSVEELEEMGIEPNEALKKRLAGKKARPAENK